MKIGSREIGPEFPPYIIAELGVNHDGSLEKALELTRAAATTGVDAVKMQLFEAERLMSRGSRLAGYQEAAGETDPVAMLRRLEMPLEAMARVVECAHGLNLHAIVTVFSLELVAPAQELAWDAYKAASPDIINRPLLEAMAGMGEAGMGKSEVGSGWSGGRGKAPLIVSTGASTLQEVARALTWLHPIRERLAVLQCVSSYPTGANQAELGGIQAIGEIFPGIVGYSDHTEATLTAALAVALGARVLEKHLTLDKSSPGPDHAASLTPKEMTEYVSYARKSHDMREHLRTVHPPEDLLRFVTGAQKVSSKGTTFERVKRVLPIEEDVRRVSRQSVVTTRTLGAGHRVRREDLTIKRPGTGIPPFQINQVLGRLTRHAVEGDVPLREEDLD